MREDLLDDRVRAGLDALDLDPAVLRAPALRGRIRRRRRARGWGAAAAGAVLVAGLVPALPALLPARSVTVLPGATMTADPTPTTNPAASLCGAPEGYRAVPDGRLTTAVHALPLDGPGIVRVDFTLTNPSAARLRGTAGYVDVTLVRDGVVVGLPAGRRDLGLPVDLAPGASTTLAGSVALQDCRQDVRIVPVPGEPSVSLPAVTLTAGTYQLFAAVTIVADSGRTDVVRGGPFPLTLR